MAQLKLSFCGPFRAELAGELVTGFRSDKVRALLAYLAVQAAQPHRREALAGLLWPEIPDQAARANLRLVLVRLRQALGSPAFLLVTPQTVQFNPDSSFELDVAEFTRLFRAGQAHRHRRLSTCPVCRPQLEAAAALYQGHFLSDFSTDSVAFENWLGGQREALQQQAREVFGALVEGAWLRGDLAAAQVQARRQLALEAGNERAQQILIQALALTGQRSAALAQYETCRRLLTSELGVEPSPETRRLYAYLQAPEGQPLPGRPPVNLPNRLTPFIGRQAELRQVLDLLQDPDCRLLTLVGPGGIGKTRLALEAAAQAGAFAQGVFFVPLLAVNSETRLLTALAQALDFSFAGAEPLQTQLVRYLSQREVLLVLDNFEHLLSAELGAACLELLLALLRAAPQVVLLVTSRERLNLQPEMGLVLKGLTYPEGAQAQAETYAAVQLFVERARLAQPDFALSAANVAEVVRVCRLVEGLPLGIELAASWIGALTCSAIAEAIGRNLRLLSAVRHDLPERHRSLRAVFEQSWRLLSVEEQRTFVCLAVFRGGFTLEAAQVVAGADLLGLSTLAAKSLLRVVMTEGLAGTRYELHETLRQYAAESLTHELEWQPQVQAAHLAYYARFARQQDEGWRQGEHLAVLAAVESELGNLLAAWEQAVALRAVEALGWMILPLTRLYEARGWYQAGSDLFASPLAALQAETLPEAQVVWGRLAAYRASFLMMQGRVPETRALACQAIDILRRHAVNEPLSLALNILGGIHLSAGAYAAAQTALRESLTIQRELGNRLEILAPLANLGVACIFGGDYAAAQAVLEEGLALCYELGVQHGLARFFNNLGLLYYAQGDWAAAERYYAQALPVSEALGRAHLKAVVLINLGKIRVRQGQFAQALADCQTAVDLMRSSGDRQNQVEALTWAGLAHHGLGAGTAAQACLGEALTIALDMQSPPALLGALVGAALWLLAHGRSASGIDLLQQVGRHPATDVGDRQYAQELLAEQGVTLAEELSGAELSPLAEAARALIAEWAEAK